MSNFVRVMDRLKLNASGQEFKIDEVITADIWNPKEIEPEKMGGFNFSTEDKYYSFYMEKDAYENMIKDSKYKDNKEFLKNNFR